MKRYSVLLLLLSFISVHTVHAKVASTRISLTKNSWESSDEALYQQFIKTLGLAVTQKICKSLDECLRNPKANPLYAAQNPRDLSRIFADCADLPYILRGYFAWMNGLPFSYSIYIDKRDPVVDQDRDPRYSSKGNFVKKSRTLKSGESFNDLVVRINNAIDSAHFRTLPLESPVGSKYDPLYPVSISRSSIVPGTLVYDPSGHIAVVTAVSDEGVISMIDAHPDNSLTTKVFNSTFMRSRPEQGGGFKRFRPLKIVNKKLLVASNEEIPDFSLEQYIGNQATKSDSLLNWKAGRFILKSRSYSFMEYVRQKLSLKPLIFQPVKELEAQLTSLCTQLQDRVSAVAHGTEANIHLLPHPERLPDNIFGTEGEWEEYATPGRDSRIKLAILEIRESTLAFAKRYKDGDATVVYKGVSLKEDLLKIYKQKTTDCKVNYKNSSGGLNSLNADQVIKRIFKLSFDPYHCPELKWGAQSKEELRTCRDDQYKIEWYKAQQGMRNWLSRYTDLKMDVSLSELQSSDLGERETPKIDIQEAILSL